MEMNKRRRSSRLQQLQADSVDDDAKFIGRSSGKDSVLKRNPKPKNSTTQAPATQTIGRRRTRSSENESSSSLTTNKRRKGTVPSKSELSVSTKRDQTTAIATRRLTRSFTKQMQTKTKTVTPSPVPSTNKTKFFFASTSKASNRRFKFNNDDESRSDIPPEVICLYSEQENEIKTSSISFESPANMGSGKRRAHTRQGNQQLQNYSKNRGRAIMSTIGGPVSSSSSTPESVTTDYIRSYGEDYWRYLHVSERPIRPIIDDPSTLKPSNKRNESKPHAETPKSSSCSTEGDLSNPMGSPASWRSSSTSSSSTIMSKVTPEKVGKKRKGKVQLTVGWIQPLNTQPQLSEENALAMSIQPALTPKMRCILVDWMIELSEHFDFGPSTLHLAVTLVDRVLASGMLSEEEQNSNSRATSDDSSFNDYDSDSYYSDDDSKYENIYEDLQDDQSRDTRNYMIPRDRFQLLGACCVWLACKIEESKAPKVHQIAYVSDHLYSFDQIVRMERRVCNALNFSFLEAPTPYQFVFEFMRASLAGCSPQQQDDASCRMCANSATATGVSLATESVFRDMVLYLLELGRMPYGPTSKNPSLLAAAAVYLARVTLGIPRALKDAAESVSSTSAASHSDSSLDSSLYHWTPTLKYYTGYTQSDLRETVFEIHQYHKAAEACALKAVFQKYKSKDYHRVALKTVVREEDLGFS